MRIIDDPRGADRHLDLPDGTGFTCKQEASRALHRAGGAAVDRNAGPRAQRIRACAETRCRRKYGNTACKVT